MRVSEPDDSERAALIALYHSTGGGNWNLRTNWLSDKPVSDWWGVSTDQAGRVTALGLDRNGLVGRIPREIATLTSLEVLSLSENRLDGTIPSELGQLSDLAVLDLSRNEFSGEMPVALTQLDNLRIFSLSGNRLTGGESFPISEEDRAILENFYLTTSGRDWVRNDNWLSDKPLQTWYGVAVNAEGRVTALTLVRNGLVGHMPEEIGDVAYMERLLLHINGLTGEIPVGVTRLAKLQWLALGDNRLRGKIPAHLDDLADLRSLYLGNFTPMGSNRFTGCIPSGLRTVANNDLAQLGLPYCQ